MLSGKNIVVAVSGGIAAYKAAELVRLLGREGASVQVAMTRAARKFVGELTFQALSRQPVATDLFDLGQESRIGHISIAERADLLVVAPATADLIARLAAGLGDDIVTTMALVVRCPLLLAPAMNANMWSHPLVQANVERLRGLGRVQLVGPASGDLACGWVGPGRMAEPPRILAAIERLLAPQDLAGRRVLVTAGPTYEPLDPVRFLGNRSSGRMGFAVAREAAVRGAAVALVAGPTALADPDGVAVTRVETAEEMRAAVRSAWEAGLDAVVMAAAVADWRPAAVAPAKLKRAGAPPVIALAANADILAELGARRRAAGGGRPILVGFAAETGAPEAEARRKLDAKGVDLVVANDVTLAGSGFGTETNRVTFVDHQGSERLECLPKREVARRLWDRLAPSLA